MWLIVSSTSPLRNPPRSSPPEAMSKSTTVSIALDEDAYLVFQNASEIVSKAGIRVPTRPTRANHDSTARYRGFRPRKIAQRFLKSVMEQVGALAGQDPDEEEDDTIPTVSSPEAE